MLKHARNACESLEQVDFPDQIASGFFQKPKDLSFRMRMCTAAGCLAEVHGWPPLPQYGYLPAFVAKSWGIVLHLIVFLLQKKLKHQPCITLALSRPFIVTETLPWILAVFEEQPFAHTIPTRVSVLGAVFACFFFWIFQETGEIDIQKVPFKDRITIEAMQNYLQTLGDTKSAGLVMDKTCWGHTLFNLFVWIPLDPGRCEEGLIFLTVRSRWVIK